MAATAHHGRKAYPVTGILLEVSEWYARSMSRLLVVTMMMTCSLFACATDKQTKRWTFGDTLKVMERVTTEQELLDAIGPPHSNVRFYPGSARGPGLLNRPSREFLKRTEVYVPASLIDELPLGTRVLVYHFHYGAALTGGGLDVYVDEEGKIFGYCYSKSLVGLTRARMNKRSSSSE